MVIMLPYTGIKLWSPWETILCSHKNWKFESLDRFEFRKWNVQGYDDFFCLNRSIVTKSQNIGDWWQNDLTDINAYFLLIYNDVTIAYCIIEEEKL